MRLNGTTMNPTLTVLTALLLARPGQSATPVPFAPAPPDLEAYQQKIPASFEGYYGELYRPQFHYTSYINWTSDPNGLAYYDGTYHLFYQHNPMGRFSKVPFWGHAVSTDLVHWRQEPCVFPSSSSGSAVVDVNNTTGLAKGGKPALITFRGNTSRGYGVVRFAYSTDNAKTWSEFEPEPKLLAHADPKVLWHEPCQQWTMITFTWPEDNHTFRFYTSKDMKRWTLRSTLKHEFSECPDLYELAIDGDPARRKWVFNVGNGSYDIGSFDGQRFVAEEGRYRLDYGNFYASQTWANIPKNDGRVIQIAWLYGGGEHVGMRFNDQLTFPCEITLQTCPEGVRACRQPIREIEKLYDKLFRLEGVVLAPGSNPLADITGDTFDIDLVLETGTANTVGFDIREHPLVLSVAEKTLTFLGSTVPVALGQGRIRLRLLVDRSSVEIFANQGQTVLTRRFLPKPGATALGLFAHGGTARIVSLNVRTLKSVWASLPGVTGVAGLSPTNVSGAEAPKPVETKPLQDKTLVVWAAPANLTQRGGSVLTLEDQQDHFDAIVFAEQIPGRWMAGSDSFCRTQKDQAGYVAETADANTFVQMAIVYHGKQVAVYRNGTGYAQHTIAAPQSFGPDSMAVFGLRHLTAGDRACFAGTIDDARIYDCALSVEQLRSLKPNHPSDPKPWAWWTFENGQAEDLMKTFPAAKLFGNARVEKGWLVLDGQESYALFRRAEVLPKQEPGLYHPPGMSMWDTWYLQRGDETHVFHLQLRRDNARRASDHESIGHAVSRDLIHWQELPVALRKGPLGSYDDSWALFTGCAVEHSSTVYLFYCGNHQPADRCRQSMCLATSPSQDGVNFTRHAGNPIIEPDPKRYYSIHEPPATFKFHAWPHIDCRDLAIVKNPSGDGWLGYVVMRRKGRADAFHSACIALCRSKDLVHWEVGDPVCTPNRFNCFEVPDVFPLGDKWYLIALTGDGYGQSRRWSDPNVTAATIVFQADRPDGPFEEVQDNLLLASTGQQGYSARTVERQGERLMLYTRTSEPYARLARPVKLVPRVGGGLNPAYWPGLDRAFGSAQSLPAMEMDAHKERLVRLLPGVPTNASSFMVTATMEFQGANTAGFQFGQSGTRPGFAVELRPQEGPAGQVSLVALSGQAIQTRHWPLPKSAHQLRLIVVEQMVDAYVDDVLVINRCVPELRPGPIGLAARGGPVAFKEIRYTNGGK